MLKRLLSPAFLAALLALLIATFSLPSFADEASVKKGIEAKLGGKVTSVSKSHYLGLYEVYVDGQILYTDDKITAILAGTLIDGKTMKNVTAERMQRSLAETAEAYGLAKVPAAADLFTSAFLPAKADRMLK